MFFVGTIENALQGEITREDSTGRIAQKRVHFLFVKISVFQWSCNALRDLKTIRIYSFGHSLRGHSIFTQTEF